MKRITGTVTYNNRNYLLTDYYTPGVDDLPEIKTYTRQTFEHLIGRDNPGLPADSRPVFHVTWEETEANPIIRKPGSEVNT